jgi:DNA-binding MarR family transcriptional regulator
MPAAAPSPAIQRAIEGLQRLVELFAERRRQLAREAGISEGEWQLLEEIAGERFMPSLFARRRQVTPAAVSRTLRQLKERGCVRATIDGSDARQRSYRLTREGRRVLERLRASRARAIAAIWAPLPTAELERFGHFASILARRLEAYAQAPRAPAGADRALTAEAGSPNAARAPAGATRRRSARRAPRR